MHLYSSRVLQPCSPANSSHRRSIDKLRTFHRLIYVWSRCTQGRVTSRHASTIHEIRKPSKPSGIRIDRKPYAGVTADSGQVWAMCRLTPLLQRHQAPWRTSSKRSQNAQCMPMIKYTWLIDNFFVQRPISTPFAGLAPFVAISFSNIKAI